MVHPLDLVSASIIVGYVLVGSVRGALVAGLSLAGFVLSYVAAIIAPSVLAGPLASATGLSAFSAGILSSLAALIVVSLCFSIPRRVIVRRRRAMGAVNKGNGGGKGGPSSSSRLIGGLIGGVSAIVVTACVGWCYDMATTGPVGMSLPPVATSVTTHVAGPVVEGGLYLGLSQGVERRGVAAMFAALLSHPSRTAEGVRLLASLQGVPELASDQTFVSLLLAGDESGLAQHVPLLALKSDPGTTDVIKWMGLAPKGIDAFLSDLAWLGGRVGRVVNDAGAQTAFKDLADSGLLQSGNTTALMTDPRFAQILSALARSTTSDQ